MKKIYPDTKYTAADVIAAKGALCIGCEIADGKIMPALSAVQITEGLFAEVKAAGASAAAGTVLLWADGKVFRSADGLNFSELAELPAQNPFMFEQRENGGAILYAAGDNACVYFGGNAGGLKQLNRNIYGGQIKNGRLFGADGTDKFKLRWSGEGGAFDWDESIDGAGWLNFDGAGGSILNLLVYGEKLVAVRENCLSVISAFGTPENFKIELKNTDIANVFKNTAAVAGNKLIFYAGGKLYAFNGAVISEIADPLTKSVENPVGAIGAGAKYMISGYIKPLGRKAVLVYDTAKGTAYIADFPADALILYGGIFAYCGSAACKLANTNESSDINGGQSANFTFKSGKISFGTNAKKYLHRVEIDCAGSADIEISNGRTKRTFKNVKNALRADMCGSIFTVSVKCNTEIAGIKAVAEVADGI